MPIGGFLDTLPAFLFVAIHLMLLAVAAWAAWRANADGAAYAGAFGLYAATQIVFLGFFAGVITMKTAVLVEQVLVMVLVVWIALAPRQARAATIG